MKIETKYNLNDKVWLIDKDFKKEWVQCEACGGEGDIVLKDNRTRTCPECYGRKGKDMRTEIQWTPSRVLTIGQIKVEIDSFTPDGILDYKGHYDPDKFSQRTSYMAYETGIGSGSIWYEDWLYLTYEEALAECEIRNKKEAINAKEPKGGLRK